MNGPAYGRSPRSEDILEGCWFEGTPSVCADKAEFLVGFGDVPSQSLPESDHGYWFGGGTPGSDLPKTWSPLTLPGNASSASDPVLIDPGKKSFLETFELIQSYETVVSDLRSAPGNARNTFHTLPVDYWLHTSNDDGPVPPYYQSYAFPRGSTGTDPVFLFVHGYTGSPGNWDYLSREFEGYGYYCPMLPGHGLKPEGFATYGAHDWFGSVEYLANRFREEHASSIGVGLSMGGALILSNWRAFDALVLINTPLRIPDWRRVFLPLFGWFKTYHEFTDSEKVIPVSSLQDLSLALKWGRDCLDDVQKPVLVINHQEDRTVSTNHGRVLSNQLPDANHLVLEEGIHESPTDPKVANKLHEEITNWLHRRSLL